MARFRAILMLLCCATMAAWGSDAPYGGVPWNVPGIIQAEDYNAGGLNHGYFDTTKGNKGGLYRHNDVDIWSSASQGHYVGAMVKDEWLEYNIVVDSTDNYTVYFTTATIDDDASLHIEIDGVNVSGEIEVPNSGGWQAWSEFSQSGIELGAGEHTLRLVVDSGRLNLSSFEFMQPDESLTNASGFSTHPAIKYNGKSYGIAWCDLDGDDLPEMWDPRHFDNDVIYKWNGNKLKTIKIPVKSRDTHAVSCVDFDNDGDLDVFIAGGGNRGKDKGAQPNLLYRNDGGLIFKEIGKSLGLRYQMSRGRHAVWMSLDDDALIDVVLLVGKRKDKTFPNTMLVQRATGFKRLRDLTAAKLHNGGLIYVGGNPFLILTHSAFPGQILRPTANSWAKTNLPGWTYGKLKFTEDFELIDNGMLGADIVLCSRKTLGLWIIEQRNGKFRAPRKIQGGTCGSMAVADFDNDGDQEIWLGKVDTATAGDYNGDGCLDVFTTKREGRQKFLVNNQCGNRNWVRIRLRGTASPIDAYGAEVILNGKQYRIHQYTTRRAFDEPLVHFGLGAATSASVKVRWPSGKVSMHKLKINRLNEVVEP